MRYLFYLNILPSLFYLLEGTLLMYIHITGTKVKADSKSEIQVKCSNGIILILCEFMFILMSKYFHVFGLLFSLDFIDIGFKSVRSHFIGPMKTLVSQ